MINTNNRKLCLSGWLKNHSSNSYNTSLKLQKFLFLYESFSKVYNKEHDFTYLKGYHNGPIFSNVYGDYTYRNSDFEKEVDKAYNSHPEYIITDFATKADFIVKILNTNELSELTHKMNIWKSKEKQILSNEKNVSLDEKDFNENDFTIIKSLYDAYTEDEIKNTKIIDVGKNHFLISNSDIERLKEEHLDALYVLSTTKDLKNPVYVSINSDGGLEVD